MRVYIAIWGCTIKLVKVDGWLFVHQVVLGVLADRVRPSLSLLKMTPSIFAGD